MIFKNKILIATITLIIAGGLSFGGYMLFNKLNDKQETSKEEKVPEINQEEHDNYEETTKKENDYYWDGMYSDGIKTYTIIKFEGYAFMYDSEQTMGVRILEEKNSELLTFKNDMTLKIVDNNLIVDSKTNTYKHYAGTYLKENFENHWSGDYKLNYYDLRLRQISDDKVFYRIINNKEDKETYDIATITKSGLVDSRITVRKSYVDSDVELTINSTDLEFYFKEAKGLYTLNS